MVFGGGRRNYNIPSLASGLDTGFVFLRVRVEVLSQLFVPLDFVTAIENMIAVTGGFLND